LKRGLPQRLGMSSERIAPLASATSQIAVASNLLKGTGNKVREGKPNVILRNRQREREKQEERSERRSSVLKSLAVLGIGDDDDDDIETFCFDSKPARRRRNSRHSLEDNLSGCEARKGRYLRRGSVTKHKLNAEVSGIQPNSRCVGGEGDETDYGSDYDGDSVNDTARKKPSLRRGSVTKYVLDAKVSGIQPNSRCVGGEGDESDYGSDYDGDSVNDTARKKPYLRRGSVTKYVLDAKVDEIQPNSRCVGGEGDESDYGSDYDGDSVNDTDRKKPYLRRGSVTKYVLDAKVDEIQPNSRCVGGEGDESDYGSDYDGDSVNDAERKRPYLRRGSVTKYVLDAKVDGIQPTRVFEDSRNRPRPSLPPPPKNKNTSERHATDYSASLPPLPRGASRPPLRPPSSQSNNLDDSGHVRAILSQDKNTRSVSKPNIDDSECRRLPKTNLDDSGHVPMPRRISSSSIDEDSAISEQEFHTPVAAAAPVKEKKSTAVRRKSGKAWSASGDKRVSATKKKSRSSKKTGSRSGVVQPQPSSPPLQGCLKREETKRRALAKKVRFGELVITEFPIILGDNPAVTSGAPVTIDWTPQGEVSYTINVYESVRGTRRRRRKLLITVSNRAILLLAAGYSIDEIADASINAQQIKYGRQESMQNQSWDRLNMMMETTNSTLGSLMENTGKKIKAIVKPMQHSEIARTA
jgi:hypothetical protein